MHNQGSTTCRPCVIVSRGPQSAKSLGEPGFGSRQVPPTPRGLQTAELDLYLSPRPPDLDDHHNPPLHNPYTRPTCRQTSSDPRTISDEVEFGVLPPEHAVHRPDPTRAVASAHPQIAEAPCPPLSMPSRCDLTLRLPMAGDGTLAEPISDRLRHRLPPSASSSTRNTMTCLPSSRAPAMAPSTAPKCGFRMRSCMPQLEHPVDDNAEADRTKTA